MSRFYVLGLDKILISIPPKISFNIVFQSFGEISHRNLSIVSHLLVKLSYIYFSLTYVYLYMYLWKIFWQDSTVL